MHICQSHLKKLNCSKTLTKTPRLPIPIKSPKVSMTPDRFVKQHDRATWLTLKRVKC